MNQDLLEQLKKLSEEELKHLFSKVQKSKTSVKRFENGVVCPICGKKHIQKFGSSSGIQRYRCKDCSKTFTEYTKTVFLALKKIMTLGSNTLN